MTNSIYINTIKQISVQQPLSDEWFDAPVQYADNYVRAIDPDYKQYFTPNEARRLGKILKRALLVSREAMKDSGVANPDAIITGTGLGCIENTEIFLDKLVREGEELLNPTHFMQSTHNTISSLVAIDAKCHNYNTTYAHKGISFECALQDAFLQMSLPPTPSTRGGVKTALVGAHDEMTPAYFTLLQKGEYLGRENQVFAGETAVAMMLSTEKTENAYCKIEAVEKVYGGLRVKPAMTDNQPDYIMVGTNGVAENDNVYFENCAKLFSNVPLLQYKNVFGESYTAPALGVYAAALCLKKGKIPDFLILDTRHKTQDTRPLRNILCYNHFENKNHTFVLLSNV
ncbi:MAG: beta-ketoacyl synthase chain length factor [Prevotellaceae bacterium]|jgi:3-oxoacyl-(acyl-carrier-protein) synthase|nr:beta-ketoacyl synthase chain length factor [Prevotellaceae bacterium]